MASLVIRSFVTLDRHKATRILLLSHPNKLSYTLPGRRKVSKMFGSSYSIFLKKWIVRVIHCTEREKEILVHSLVTLLIGKTTTVQNLRTQLYFSGHYLAKCNRMHQRLRLWIC